MGVITIILDLRTHGFIYYLYGTEAHIEENLGSEFMEILLQNSRNVFHCLFRKMLYLFFKICRNFHFLFYSF